MKVKEPMGTTKELCKLQEKLMTYPTLDRDAWLVEVALDLLDETLKLRKAAWSACVEMPSDQSRGYQTLDEALGGQP